MIKVPFNSNEQIQYLSTNLNPHLSWKEKDSFVGTFFPVGIRRAPVFQVYGIMFEITTYTTQVLDIEIYKLLSQSVDHGLITGLWTFKQIDKFYSLQLLECMQTAQLKSNDYLTIYKLLYSEQLIRCLIRLKERPDDEQTLTEYRQVQKHITEDLKKRGLAPQIKKQLMGDLMKQV